MPKLQVKMIAKSGIIDGRAWTGGDISLLTDLTEGQQIAVLDWIKNNFIPVKRMNYFYTSYSLKSIAENDLHFEITNNQFKDAMLKSGYIPHDERQEKWAFGISKNSPCFG